MPFQDFVKLGVFYNGNALTRITSIAIATDAGNQPVDLLNEGLAGFTDGSGRVTIDVGFVVPIGGTEDTFQEDCANKAFVTLQIPVGGKAYIGRGKVMTVNISQSTNANTEGTFNWVGELKPFA